MNRKALSTLVGALVGVVVATLGLSGCQFDGIGEMALPGGVGTGDDAIEVTVELPDVGTLTPNAQVKVDDIAVGTVREVSVADWHAEAVLSIEPDVHLPANATASVGVNTLLGAAYVELAAPERPRGELVDGARIPLERGHAYPSTEQVLSAASLALNGGGLEQVSTITTELNNVLGGNDRAVGDLLPRVEEFLTALNDQRADILAAVEDVATMSKRFAGQRHLITRALDQIGPALETLSTERPNITGALRSLTDLAHVVVPLVTDVRDDLVSDLENLDPVIRAILRAGDSTVTALGFAVTFPFAPETVTNVCRGDYCNLTAILDLTNSAITHGFVKADGSLAIPGFPGLDLSGLLGLLGGGGNLDGVPELLSGLAGGEDTARDQPNLSLSGLLGGSTGGQQ